VAKELTEFIEEFLNGGGWHRSGGKTAHNFYSNKPGCLKIRLILAGMGLDKARRGKARQHKVRLDKGGNRGDVGVSVKSAAGQRQNG